MRWLVRVLGDDEEHLADIDAAGDTPAERFGRTLCGRAGRLQPQRPARQISGDELVAAAMGVCPRCVSRHG